MLKNITESIVINGQSFVGEDPVMTLSANIPRDTQVGSVSQYIQNPELYEANKKECRKDAVAFQNRVYEIEDSLAADEKK